MKLPGVEEDVGLIGIHWKGQFIELVPWTASVNWDVDPWGRWKVLFPFREKAIFAWTYSYSYLNVTVLFRNTLTAMFLLDAHPHSQVLQ